MIDIKTYQRVFLSDAIKTGGVSSLLTPTGGTALPFRLVYRVWGRGVCRGEETVGVSSLLTPAGGATLPLRLIYRVGEGVVMGWKGESATYLPLHAGQHCPSGWYIVSFGQLRKGHVSFLHCKFPSWNVQICVHSIAKFIKYILHGKVEIQYNFSMIKIKPNVVHIMHN